MKSTPHERLVCRTLHECVCVRVCVCEFHAHTGHSVSQLEVLLTISEAHSSRSAHSALGLGQRGSQADLGQCRDHMAQLC